MYNTFDFIGNFNFFKDGFQIDNFPSGWNKKSLKASINSSKNNGIWLSFDGMWKGQYEDDIESSIIKRKSKKIFGQDAYDLDIAWDDRQNPAILSQLSDMHKTIVDLGSDEDAKKKMNDISREIFFLEGKDAEKVEDGDREKLDKLYDDYEEAKKAANRLEFIHPIDAINFFVENKGKLDGEMFHVKGNVEISYYKGKFYTNYKPTHFIFVGHQENIKPKLSATLDLFFSDNLIDDSLYEKSKLIRYKTYIMCYDSDYKADKFFPMETVFNGKDYKADNPNHVAHETIIKKFMAPADEGKVKHIAFEVSLISGSEEREFTKADLTEEQLMMVEAGFNSIDDFKKTTYGDRYEEVRLRIPLLKNMEDKGDFSKGAVLAPHLKKSDLTYVPKQGEAPAQNDTAKDNTPNTGGGNTPMTFDEDDLPF